MGWNDPVKQQLIQIAKVEQPGHSGGIASAASLLLFRQIGQI